MVFTEKCVIFSYKVWFKSQSAYYYKQPTFIVIDRTQIQI